MLITIDVPPEDVKRIVDHHRKQFEGKTIKDLSGPEVCSYVASDHAIIEAEIQVFLKFHCNPNPTYAGAKS